MPPTSEYPDTSAPESGLDDDPRIKELKRRASLYGAGGFKQAQKTAIDLVRRRGTLEQYRDNFALVHNIRMLLANQFGFDFPLQPQKNDGADFANAIMQIEAFHRLGNPKEAQKAAIALVEKFGSSKSVRAMITSRFGLHIPLPKKKPDTFDLKAERKKIASLYKSDDFEKAQQNAISLIERIGDLKQYQGNPKLVRKIRLLLATQFGFAVPPQEEKTKTPNPKKQSGRDQKNSRHRRRR